MPEWKMNSGEERGEGEMERGRQWGGLEVKEERKRCAGWKDEMNRTKKRRKAARDEREEGKEEESRKGSGGRRGGGEVWYGRDVFSSRANMKPMEAVANNDCDSSATGLEHKQRAPKRGQYIREALMELQCKPISRAHTRTSTC
ncbi:hypothetical protein E2C01_081536 [Portunus trituberculatus]|uniref:Uncharacterized protein n=1 Tax=Portunus trituberculatus TaxID=210409 RepID=A0A5B7IQ11_PORTR|nr:hypothetical protein [Portunus trituberculatus]